MNFSVRLLLTLGLGLSTSAWACENAALYTGSSRAAEAASNFGIERLRLLLGPDVEQGLGKIVLTSGPIAGGALSRSTVGGVLADDLIPGEDEHQMWEAQVIFIALSKFRSKARKFVGRIDQVLTDVYHVREEWDTPYLGEGLPVPPPVEESDFMKKTLEPAVVDFGSDDLQPYLHKAAARLVVQRVAGGGTLVAGSLIEAFPSGEDWEMWEGRMILVPQRKYRGFAEGGGRIDQVLTGGFAEPNKWREQIFGPPSPER